MNIGTNDLAHLRPEVVGSEIEELVHLLLESFPVKVIGVCEVLPRINASLFNGAASILNQYLFGVSPLLGKHILTEFIIIILICYKRAAMDLLSIAILLQLICV